MWLLQSAWSRRLITDRAQVQLQAWLRMLLTSLCACLLRIAAPLLCCMLRRCNAQMC